MSPWRRMPARHRRRLAGGWRRLREALERLRSGSRAGRTARARTQFWDEVRQGQREAEARARR